MSKPVSLSHRLAGYCGVVVIVFALYRALPFTTLIPTLIARKLTFLFLMAMVYLTTDPWNGARGFLKKGINIVTFLIGAVSIFYLIWLWQYLPNRMMVGTPTDVVFCSLMIIVTLDLLRRKTGWPLVIITTLFILYVVYGTAIPIAILKHEPYSWGDAVFALGTGPRGIWGTPLGVILDFVVLFIAFGSVLLSTGVIDYFLRLACFMTKRFSSGPGLVALISSTLFGMISGSAAANVSTTGNFTIPLMKKVGYPAETAAGIEVAASIGGQWMPPVMGAGAFIMAGILGIPFVVVMQNAIIPALLYFLAVAAMIVAISGKLNLQPMPDSEYEILAGTTFIDWLYSSLQVGLPVVALMYYLIAGYSAGAAAAYALILLVGLTLLLRPKDVSLKERIQKIWDGLNKAGFSVLSVAMACAAAGIIVGAIVTTGTAVKFTALIVGVSGGSIIIAIVLVALTSYFIGMGAPITAAYLIVAVVAAGALQKLGVPIIVAHLICFWFAVDSEVTPPVCISSYAAAGIAGSHPWKTAMQGWKAAKGLYIIPVLVATSPIVPATWEGNSFISIFLAILTAILGIIVLSFVLERFFLKNLNWFETGLFAGIGVLLMLPYAATDYIGIATFIAITLFFYLTSRKHRGINPSATV